MQAPLDDMKSQAQAELDKVGDVMPKYLSMFKLFPNVVLYP